MSFSLDLSKAIKNINEETERVVRGTIYSLSAKIIEATPVGNPDLWMNPAPPGYVGGSLRGAWNASIGAPDSTITNKIDENGFSTISEMSNKALSLEIGQTYYLTNPLPYAYRVEYGWSSQAPQGMVRLSVMQAQTELDRLAK